MSDLREALRHGDVTSTGGMLTSTVVGFGHEGVPVAAEGDHATCPACKAGGPVQNDADVPFTLPDGRRLLVRGARVMCLCADKPVVIPSQHHFVVEVRGPGHVYRPARLTHVPMAAERLTGDRAGMLVDDTERICSNMSNAEFHATMMRLRDRAVGLMGSRLEELARWNEADRDKVRLWFGDASDSTRKTLRDGLTRMREIMGRLRETNFERYSEEGVRRVGCVPRARDGEIEATASVCKPDGTYSIFVGEKFCLLDDERNHIETGIPFESDSKLTVLIHEISHFPLAMNSDDHQPSFRFSRAAARRSHAFCIENADSISAYVANIPNWQGNTPVWRP